MACRLSKAFVFVGMGVVELAKSRTRPLNIVSSNGTNDWLVEDIRQMANAQLRACVCWP